MMAALCNKTASMSPPPLADAAVGKGFHPWKKSGGSNSPEATGSQSGGRAGQPVTTSPAGAAAAFSPPPHQATSPSPSYGKRDQICHFTANCKLSKCWKHNYCLRIKYFCVKLSSRHEADKCQSPRCQVSIRRDSSSQPEEALYTSLPSVWSPGSSLALSSSL